MHPIVCFLKYCCCLSKYLLVSALCVSLLVYVQIASTASGRGVNRCVGPSYGASLAVKANRPITGTPVKWAIVSLAKPNDSRMKIRNAAIAEKVKPFASKHDITAIVFSELPVPDAVDSEWRRTFEAGKKEKKRKKKRQAETSHCIIIICIQ